MPAKATRDAFGEALASLGDRFPDIVAMDADLAKSTKSEMFAKKFPQRFFEFGIAEANMIGTAAGLALAGKIPFACSFACFISSRFDQIRISVAYSQANVRLVGSHAGIAIGNDDHPASRRSRDRRGGRIPLHAQGAGLLANHAAESRTRQPRGISLSGGK